MPIIEAKGMGLASIGDTSKSNYSRLIVDDRLSMSQIMTRPSCRSLHALNVLDVKIIYVYDSRRMIPD